MISALFRLRQANLWGDYGSVLISGYASRDAALGQLSLHRSGPFAPPIFFPWGSDCGPSVVVTQTFRQALERADFGRLSFRPVSKKRIVEFHWHNWDRSADEPAEHPNSGEPEDYIWDGQHSRRAASQMEELWELIAPVVPCEIERQWSKTLGVPDTFHFRPAGKEYRGLFRNREEYFDLVVDSPTRQWFEKLVAEWVGFDDLIFV